MIRFLSGKKEIAVSLWLIMFFVVCSNDAAAQRTVALQKNKTFASQVRELNTIYEVSSHFDLRGATVVLPEGCTLKFKGGSLKNGTLTGAATVIVADPMRIFANDLKLQGGWNITAAYAEWFGAKGNGKADDTSPIQKTLDAFGMVNLLASTYRISTVTMTSSMKMIGCGPYQTKLIAVSDREDGIVIRSQRRTKYVEIESLQVSGFKNGIHFTRSERCKMTDVISNNCTECACLFDGGCWIMVLRNCKFHNSMTGLSCGLDGVITSTFDFHSCCFYENKKYGFDGVCNNINFIGGYSELNGISGMRFNIKKPSLNVTFLGFDMESNKRYGIDFSTDDKPAENTAYVVNFHYIGGQIETMDDGTGDNASIYFGGPKLSSNYWLNVNFNTRVTGSSTYIIKSLGNISLEGSLQLTTSGKKWATSHSVAVDPVTIGALKDIQVDLKQTGGEIKNKRLFIAPNEEVMIPLGEISSIDIIRIEGTKNARLSVVGYGMRDNEYKSRASMQVVLSNPGTKSGMGAEESTGFRGVRGIRYVYLKNVGAESVSISTIEMSGQATIYQTISELIQDE